MLIFLSTLQNVDNYLSRFCKLLFIETASVTTMLNLLVKLCGLISIKRKRED